MSKHPSWKDVPPGTSVEVLVGDTGKREWQAGTRNVSGLVVLRSGVVCGFPCGGEWRLA